VIPVAGVREVARAAELLAAGEVIGLPTDTVYGVGARLDRPGAVEAIFELKGRPVDVALPVLIGRDADVDSVAAAWPRSAKMLAARYWPGPLTLVVPARPEIGALLGGTGDTVGVRAPKHRFVRNLCRTAGPLAVTSANRHGGEPCTTAEAVTEAFGGEGLALVVDGGRCDGEPSTVADCTTSPPTLLRQGALPWDWVLAALR